MFVAQMCVSPSATRQEKGRASQTASRQGEKAGGGVLPEGECWNIEHAVLI